MSAVTIIGGAITLHSYVDFEKKERVCLNAVLPSPAAKDWEGHRINLLHWEMDDGKAFLRYQTREGLCAPIHAEVYPVEEERLPMTPPTRSRNWELNEFWYCWRNRKTGEKIPV